VWEILERSESVSEILERSELELESDILSLTPQPWLLILKNVCGVIGINSSDLLPNAFWCLDVFL